MQNLRKLIIDFHNSSDIDEKSKIKKEIINKGRQQSVPKMFEVSILAHFDTFKMTGKKTSLESLLKFIPK